MTQTTDLITPSPDVLRFFRVLADDKRLAIVRLLVIGDLRVGEIGRALRLPSNALVYHLKQLQSLQLLRDRRSSADARDVYYRLDLERLDDLYAQAGGTLHPGFGSVAQPAMVGDRDAPRSARPLRVLFLCTHNSARSQLAEALLRQMGGDQVEACSAGSEPTAVDPDAISVLRDLGINPAPLVAKSLTAFSGQHFDYIITVCDRVRDACPVFPGDPKQVHWSFADPAVIEDAQKRRAAFGQVAGDLQTRIRYLLHFPHPTTGQRLVPR